MDIKIPKMYDFCPENCPYKNLFMEQTVEYSLKYGTITIYCRNSHMCLFWNKNGDPKMEVGTS